jgi:hypothetical protein
MLFKARLRGFELASTRMFSVPLWFGFSNDALTAMRAFLGEKANLPVSTGCDEVPAFGARQT